MSELIFQRKWSGAQADVNRRKATLQDNRRTAQAKSLVDIRTTQLQQNSNDTGLPHEAWHTVQEHMQPTMQMKVGVPVNDDKGLEQEADVMGRKAAQMRRTSSARMGSSFGASTVQRVIKIKAGNVTHSDKNDIPTIISAMGKGSSKYKGKVAELIGDASITHTFADYGALFAHLATPVVPRTSHYEGVPTIPPKYVDGGSIGLYRAMNDKEASSLHSDGAFKMYVGKNEQESGIKFFATDINYSIKLANKKNNEAYAKQEKELPYTHMIAAVLNADDVKHGLKEDIGVHTDVGHTGVGHTKKFLQEGLDDEKSLKAQSENHFKAISAAENNPDYEAAPHGHGYVLKHESEGLNFGVQAKTPVNTRHGWKSPIEYFNRLVRWAAFIGKFVMK